MTECAACPRTGIPRHVVALLNARPGVTAPPPVHIDCHADQGCATCVATLAEAGGLRGTDLAAHLAAERAARTLEASHG